MIINSIHEAKIRNAVWYLKTGKSKKFVCEYLNIPYSSKKLDDLIKQFNAAQKRKQELKAAARLKVFSLAEKTQIAKQYQNAESLASLSEQYYISVAKIKKILMELQVPLRTKTGTKVDHLDQDVDSILEIGSRVFCKNHNCYAIVDVVYDEKYLDYLEQGRQIYVETYAYNPKTSKYKQPVEGIHYEIYWQLISGALIKLSALASIRNQIIKKLEKSGREYYLLRSDNDFNYCFYASREAIYPIKAV
jgi:hypothetical protein